MLSKTCLSHGRFQTEISTINFRDIMTSTWDEWAEEWDSNEEVVIYSSNAFENLKELLNLKGRTVLDFGCGTGHLSQKLSPIAKQIVALDSSPKMIERLQAKGLPNVLPICADLSQETILTNPALKAEFDLIVASSVCAFLSDYMGTLSLINSLLDPHGIFVQWDWMVEKDQNGEGFTELEVKSALEKSGFLEVTVNKKFVMETEKGSQPVLMAVAKGNSDPINPK